MNVRKPKKQLKNQILVSLATVCVLFTGMTFALLSNITQTATNVFASERNIEIQLREPAWDGYEFTDQYPSNVKPGEQAKPGVTDLGITKASNYMPKDSIAKNPMIQNADASVSTWVAIKVEYFDENDTQISKKEFNEKYGHSKYQNTENDTNTMFNQISNKDEKSELYMYDTLLSDNQITDELFTSIEINDDLEAKDGKWPSFKIKVTGYAVQGENVTQTQAQDLLLEMAI